MAEEWKQLTDEYGEHELDRWQQGDLVDVDVDPFGHEWGLYELKLWVWLPLAPGTVNGRVHG